MANINQILGRVEIFLDGQYYPSLPGATLTYGDVERDPVVGDQVHGFVEKSVAPELTCKFAAKGAVSLDAIWNWQGNLTFNGDNGLSYMMSQAWCAKRPTVTSGTGEIAVTFNAITVDEQD